jgi:putative tricarboxylic transport membrane protein
VGIENLFYGFQVALTPFNLFVAVVGISLGTIIGVLPTSAIILLTSI